MACIVNSYTLKEKVHVNKSNVTWATKVKTSHQTTNSHYINLKS